KRRTLRSFLRRKCSQIGPATARAPNRSQGLSNEKCTFLEQASPLRQEHRQRAARVLIGSDYAMRHFQPLKQLLITVHKRVKPLEVLLAGRFSRSDDAPFATFQVFKDMRFREW